MKIVIVGAGEVGLYIARQLIDDGKSVVIIEKDPERVRLANSTLDSLVIHGKGNHVETLKEADTSNADIFIAATSSDEVNIISCLIAAAEFNVPVKVARVSNFEYSKSRVFGVNIQGVDHLVNADREAAWDISQTIEQGADGTITIFKNTDMQMREYHINHEDFFAGKTVKEALESLKEEYIIAGVVRKNELKIPNKDFAIEEDDTIYILADRRVFSRISDKLGEDREKIRRVVIIGGTSIGVAVAEYMLAKGRSVVLVDRDYEHCVQLTELLPGAAILNGDISDPTIYDDSDIKSMDAIITATGNDELNIIGGVYAKTLGVKKAVAVVEKTSYLTVAASIGIDSTVSPRFTAVNAILKLVRKGNVRSIHSLFDGQAEAIEVKLPANSQLLNIPLKDLALPDDCRVVAVDRDRKTVIPYGDFELKAYDRVVIFAKRASIAELEKMLA